MATLTGCWDALVGVAIVVYAMEAATVTVPSDPNDLTWTVLTALTVILFVAAAACDIIRWRQGAQRRRQR